MLCGGSGFSGYLGSRNCVHISVACSLKELH